jgi:hypothetical protein
MLLEQSVSTLAYQLQDVFRDGKTIAQWLQNLRQAYDAITIENKLVDGVVPYPQTKNSGDKEAIDGDTGVKIEFKYVAILYHLSDIIGQHRISPVLQRCDVLVPRCSTTSIAKHVL